MSVVDYAQAMDLETNNNNTKSDLQIWNNAAFDDDDDGEQDSQVSNFTIINPCDSLDSSFSSSKENQNPLSTNSIRPSFVEAKKMENRGGSKGIDEEIEEIESEMRRLSSRLEVLRLLKAEQNLVKVQERNKRAVVVASKFMGEEKNNRGVSMGPNEILSGSKNARMGRTEIEPFRPVKIVRGREDVKKIEELGSLSGSKAKIQKRGFSMGPNEIMCIAKNRIVGRSEMESFRAVKIDKGCEEGGRIDGRESEIQRRGLSIGPNEITSIAKNQEMGKSEIERFRPSQIVKGIESAKKIEENVSSSSKNKIQRRGFSMGPNEIAKIHQYGKQEIITPSQSRRKSCVFKLPDIEEEDMSNGRTLGSRKAVTSVGLRKGVKKEDSVSMIVQPKKLFVKDGEKSVKKPVKPGRVIASRYNQPTDTKRASQDDGKDGLTKCDKKRASSVEKSCGTESRVKKRWEIPGEIVVPKRLKMEESSPSTVSAMRDRLPRIRALRCTNETPRDSGPAKRVAELLGRKSYFCDDEEMGTSVCQALSFIEDYGEED